MAKSSDGQLRAFAHGERAVLADDLKVLEPQQWRSGTLCGQWDVEQVVAHLTAAASLNQWQWMRSMLGARFRPDVHNQRRLDEPRGTTPTETLELFRAVINSSIAPSSHTPAYLGEVIVHSQDIRQPLGLPHMPNMEALTVVAEFYARRNFTVSSRTHAAGLQLKADDGPFAAGDGPLVTGSTLALALALALALVMAMAGRVPHVRELEGTGVPMLRSRIEKPSRLTALALAWQSSCLPCLFTPEGKIDTVVLHFPNCDPYPHDSRGRAGSRCSVSVDVSGFF